MTQATGTVGSQQSTLAPAVNGAGAPVQQAQQQPQPAPVGIAGNGQSTMTSYLPGSDPHGLGRCADPKVENAMSSLEVAFAKAAASGNQQELDKIGEVLLTILRDQQKKNPESFAQTLGAQGLANMQKLEAQVAQPAAPSNETLLFVPFSRYDGLHGDDLSDAIGQDLGALMLADKARYPELYKEGAAKSDDKKKA
jgi:hypothetical protein